MFMTEHVMTEGMADMEERSMQGQGASCFHVTRMNADEISEAAALEREVFPDPWSEAMLCSGFAADSQTYFGVREQNGRLVGYAAVMTVLDEGELLRICVAPRFRRRGVAAMLMERIFRTAAERKLAFMLLEVRKGNLPAIRLYEKYGFSTEGIRKNYYQNPMEDALIMRKLCVSGEKIPLYFSE